MSGWIQATAQQNTINSFILINWVLKFHENQTILRKNHPCAAEPEMEDSDSADEKVEHYLESPEKEPQKSPEKEQPQKEEDKTCEIAASQLEQVSFFLFSLRFDKKRVCHCQYIFFSWD